MSPTRDTVPEDAFEMFMAEAARVRLSERTGHARISLRSGARLTGRLVVADAEAVDRHLHLVERSGHSLLVSTDAILSIVGACAALRDESSGGTARSLASRLRESWAAGGRVRVLLQDGCWLDGSIVLIASDHVELVVGDEPWVVPYAAVEAWDLR